MVRQARSEATRRKIITSAVELFNEIGYPATGLGDIIERAEMTKGALYYHFDSKESLATAIIEEGSANLVDAFRSITASSAPALESIIHGVFVVADLMSTDKVARSGMQLLASVRRVQRRGRTHVRRLGDGDDGAHPSGNRRGRSSRRPRSAGGRRDDRRRMLGAELLSNATTAGADVLERVARTWKVLLPGDCQPGVAVLLPTSSWRASRCGTPRHRWPTRLQLVDPQPLGQVLERRQRHRVIAAQQGRLAHPRADDGAVLVHAARRSGPRGHARPRRRIRRRAGCGRSAETSTP